MIKNKKHTLLYQLGNIFSLVLSMLFIISFIPFWGYAQNSQPESKKIVYRADNENIIITEGKITATDEKSIKLLPETHFRQGEKLVVDINNKAHQNVLNEIEAQKKEAEMLQMAAQFEALLSTGFKEATSSQLAPNHSSDKQSQLGTQNITGIAIISSFNNQVKLSSWQLIEYDPTKTHKNLALSRPTINFTPDLKWGNQTEIEKALRC